MISVQFSFRYGHDKCIRLLVEKGADINKKTKSNWTPIHVAIRQGCVNGVQTLIDCGCDINQKGGA